jgi:hypothetical protein
MTIRTGTMDGINWVTINRTDLLKQILCPQ